jgi:hypothetical protein
MSHPLPTSLDSPLYIPTIHRGARTHTPCAVPPACRGRLTRPSTSGSPSSIATATSAVPHAQTPHTHKSSVSCGGEAAHEQSGGATKMTGEERGSAQSGNRETQGEGTARVLKGTKQRVIDYPIHLNPQVTRATSTHGHNSKKKRHSEKRRLSLHSCTHGSATSRYSTHSSPPPQPHYSFAAARALFLAA